MRKTQSHLSGSKIKYQLDLSFSKISFWATKDNDNEALTEQTFFSMALALVNGRWGSGESFFWITARIRANGLTENFMRAVTSFAAKASQETFPSESCCIDIFADIVTNKTNTLVLR